MRRVAWVLSAGAAAAACSDPARPPDKWIRATSTMIYSHYDGTHKLLRTVDAQSTVSAWDVPGQHPSWSPDGTRIAYIPQFGGSLRLVNADGTNARILTATLK